MSFSDHDSSDLRDIRITLEEIDETLMRKAQDEPTLRDKFALAALAGIQGNSSLEYATHDQIAQDSYLIADAMMRAREASKRSA